MKKALLFINIVLIGLVGYLYYLHFAGSKESKSTPLIDKNQTTTSASTDSKIAYIDMDSLQNKYDYYQKIKADVEKKTAAANNEIMTLQKKFQSRAAELQQKAATMTPQEQEKAMNEINKMQQDFQNRKQNLDNELFDYNSKMKEQIVAKIEAFLKEFNKSKNFAYVFSYEPGLIYYKDSTLNITPEVVEGLNKAYKDENK